MSTQTERSGGQEAPATDSPSLRLDPLAFSGAAALVAAVIMLLLGILGAVGVYEGGVEMMEQWHLFFAPTLAGTIAGMIEAALATAIFTYVFARLYNTFVHSFE